MKGILAVLLLLLLVSDAQAHTTCFPPGDLQQWLRLSEGQSPIFTGEIDNDKGDTMQTWLNPTNGTWTIMIVKLNDWGCALATGINFSVHGGLSTEIRDEVPL